MTIVRIVARLVCLALLLVGCTERVQLTPEQPIPGLTALRVSPVDQALAIDELGGLPRTIEYTATGTFLDGTERDVTELVTWTTELTGAGTIDERGTFTTTNTAGGRIEIVAGSGEIRADAELVITIDARIVDGANPPPGDPDTLFPANGTIVELDPMRLPQLAYPAHDTMFPQGMTGVLFQHQRGTGNDATRLSFDSEYLHLEVYTGGDRWLADDAAWSAIARTNAGSSVRFTIDGAASTMPGTIYRGPAATLRFARNLADGAIYYFSRSNEGVLRSLVSSTTPAPILPTAGDTKCIGCHTVSRDGRTLAFGHGDEKLATFDVETEQPGITLAANIGMGWATYSPDDALLLVANKGELDLRDATTGASIERVELPTKATHPDWSPDGTRVAFTLTDDAMNMEVKGGSIATMTYADGVWGAPTTLVASTGDNDNNYFPKWSPDGRYLAYVHAAEPSKDAKTAELRMIPAAGGPPIRLAVASQRVGMRDGVPDLASTMPSWGPYMEGTVAWLAFASRRPYGVVRPMLGPSQIWIAAVDLERREDPSFAAFRLVAQDITQLANGPIWAVLPGPPTQ